jgi:hypothetical protein
MRKENDPIREGDIYYELCVVNKNKTVSLTKHLFYTTALHLFYTTALRLARKKHMLGCKVKHMHKKCDEVTLEDISKKV